MKVYSNKSELNHSKPMNTETMEINGKVVRCRVTKEGKGKSEKVVRVSLNILFDGNQWGWMNLDGEDAEGFVAAYGDNVDVRVSGGVRKVQSASADGKYTNTTLYRLDDDELGAFQPVVFRRAKTTIRFE